MKFLLSRMDKIIDRIKLGGGKAKLDKQHEKGKLTVRERVDLLIDIDTKFLEIAPLAGYEMYEEHGGCPCGGTTVHIGYVSGNQCVIVANDASVKAGSWFPITVKKILRAQEISTENNLPIIYLVDSAGVYLPLQDEIFPDKEDFGRIFRNNAIMSARGIVQISAVMGSCVAGGAYLPIMSDETLIVDGTGSIFLAGSYLVKAAIGEEIDNETLGGATTHTAISGIADYRCKDDTECIQKIRTIFQSIQPSELANFKRAEPRMPAKSLDELYGLIPKIREKPYETRDIIDRLVDNSKFNEYKEDFGKTIVCGTANIDGWAVGIIANQRSIIKTEKGEMRFGGVIYSDSSVKAARFIMNCNQKKIPLVFLQDVTGFMVGSRSEHEGIIKNGAKLVSAMANSIVPKFTVILGNSYGAGNYAMCGKAYDPRLIVGWPTAKIAVMGGKQAAQVLVQIQASALKKAGEQITEADKKKLLDKISKKYEKETTAMYAAARLWIDAIIDPIETRNVISLGIEAANHKPITEKYNVGIIQT
ncbi:MAG: acyl-CoA carboxylase subunit beta [Flavobacteriales bacterium]|nr:acyl-CoA carboxylase subunit beta [Flavobacteriales bacterium]